jgi:hypothetical protein
MDSPPKKIKKIIYFLGFIALSCSSFDQYFRSDEKYDIQIEIIQNNETKSIGYLFPNSENDSEKNCKDFLSILEELSIQSKIEIRFLSTNQTIEIISIDGIRNQWKKRWKIYSKTIEITPGELSKGHKVCEEDKISIRYEDTMPKNPFSKEND